MRYIAMTAAGGPEALALANKTRPDPLADEVLIKVHAIGVNRPDILQRQGFYPAPRDANPVLGLEVSGEVVASGSSVHDYSSGDLVCALCNGGGYAEYVAVPSGQCMPVNNTQLLKQSAALPEAMFTVWTNVFDRCRLTPGETLLVHGGAGGVGHIAVQMARLTGAKVFATAGSDKKVELCESFGARAINYTRENFVDVLKDEAGGADVILDIVGGDYVQQNIKACRADGRIANIAFQKSAVVDVNLMPLMLKRLTLTGSTLRSQSKQEKSKIAQNLRKHFQHFVDSAALKPEIFSEFPLAQANEAHKMLESGLAYGKVLLVP